MKQSIPNFRFAICIDNKGYIHDLRVRTIYQVLPDASAAKSNYLRIIDETGEDYLYPASYFVMIDVPREIEKTLSYSPNRASVIPKKRALSQNKSLAKPSIKRAVARP